MKKFLSFLLITAFCSGALAGVFLEPLAGSDRIYRGRAPEKSEIRRVVKTGITSVLIFKNQVKDEVDSEIRQLVRAGISREKIYNIPLMWKNFSSEQKACEQIVDALAILQDVQDSQHDKILFHCTVGEDRTGLLAGLMAQLLAVEDTESSYLNQMCRKGYAGGNSKKPVEVSEAVNKYLTPLYFKISRMIEKGILRPGYLDKKVCERISEIESNENFKPCRP